MLIMIEIEISVNKIYVVIICYINYLNVEIKYLFLQNK